MRCSHFSWLILLPIHFQDCRKLSEDVQNAILAVATVYYWLPKGQGEIATAGQSPLYRVAVPSPLYEETQYFRCMRSGICRKASYREQVVLLSAGL